MILQTLAGLTAIIATVSAIQADAYARADATAQWYYGGYNNYNPWAQQSQGYGYGGGSSPFGYGGEITRQRLHRDISYLVKMNSSLKTRVIAAETKVSAVEEENSALKTRMVAAEDAIKALQKDHEDPDFPEALAARVDSLESKTALNMMSLQENSVAFENIDSKFMENQGFLAALGA